MQESSTKYSDEWPHKHPLAFLFSHFFIINIFVSSMEGVCVCWEGKGEGIMQSHLFQNDQVLLVQTFSSAPFMTPQWLISG